MSKRKLIRYFIIFTISLLLSFLVMPVRGGYLSIWGLTGFSLSALLYGILFFSYTLICLKYFRSSIKHGYIIIAIMIGSSFDLPIIIASYKSTLISYPEILLKYIAILTVYFSYRVKSVYAKIPIILFYFTLLLWTVFSGYDLWIHKMNYNSWTGYTEEYLDRHISFQKSDGEIVGLDDFNGKYLLLDFWSSSCTYCFETFPVTESVYQQYKNDSIIEIFSVHCRVRGENFHTGIEKLLQQGYSFPSISIDINDSSLKIMGVNSFPTVLIFNPQGILVFRGDINRAAKYIDKLLTNS